MHEVLDKHKDIIILSWNYNVNQHKPVIPQIRNLQNKFARMCYISNTYYMSNRDVSFHICLLLGCIRERDAQTKSVAIRFLPRMF